MGVVIVGECYLEYPGWLVCVEVRVEGKRFA